MIQTQEFKIKVGGFLFICFCLVVFLFCFGVFCKNVVTPFKLEGYQITVTCDDGNFVAHFVACPV